jgi:hypothetical protein
MKTLANRVNKDGMACHRGRQLYWDRHAAAHRKLRQNLKALGVGVP